MKLLKLALLVGGLMLLSNTSYSQEPWRTGPSVTGATTPNPLCNRGITPGSTCFWTFTSYTGDSPIIVVSAEYAILAFDPDVAGNTATSTVEVYRVVSDICTPSTTASVNTANRMELFRPVGDGSNGTVTTVLALDGDPSTSTWMITIPFGCYYIDASNTDTKDSIVSITGSPLMVGR